MFALTWLFLATLVCAFPCRFPSTFFVQHIKYNTELHFHSISAPINDELSLQEVNLSISSEMMSWYWICETALPTELGGIWVVEGGYYMVWVRRVVGWGVWHHEPRVCVIGVVGSVA